MQPQEVITITPPPQPRKGKSKVIGIVLLLILVIAAGAFGGYYLLSKKTEAPQEVTKSQTEPDKNSSNQPALFHYVTSEGYPFGTDKKVTAKLAIPDELQGIRESSSTYDPGLADGVLGDKFNGEMGRWKLARPTLASEEYNDISLINVEDQWLKMNTTGKEDFPLGAAPFSLPIPTPNMTSTQKQAFLAQLKSETEQCVKDGKYSFVVAENINVCVVPYQIKQAAGSYSPHAYIKGYGIIDSLHFVLAGSLSLSDDKVRSADEQTKLQESFKPESLPAETNVLLERYIAALKQTTITIEKR